MRTRVTTLPASPYANDLYQTRRRGIDGLAPTPGRIRRPLDVMTSPDVTARNLLLEAELLSILDALAASDISSIVLKGVPLTRRLFDRLDAREMLDNDVLVHRQDAPRACAALEALGYTPLDCRRIERQLDFDFQYCLKRPVAGGSLFAGVDLHWNAFQPDLYTVSEEVLWMHAEPFDLRGRTILVFDKPLTLVHLAAHYAQHLFNHPSILRDVAAAWNRWHGEIDTQLLREVAGATRTVHALDYALSIATDLEMLDAPPLVLGSRRAAWMRRWLPARKLRERSAGLGYARMLLALMLAPPQQIPRWLRNLLFPPLENMSALHGEPVSAALWARYLTRPLRPIGRVLGRKM